MKMKSKGHGHNQINYGQQGGGICIHYSPSTTL